MHFICYHIVFFRQCLQRFQIYVNQVHKIRIEQSNIATMPPPHTAWSVDEHDRLLTQVFRNVWFKHGLAVPIVAHSTWITPAVWTSLQQHAAAPSGHAPTKKAVKQVGMRMFILAWRCSIHCWSPLLPFCQSADKACPSWTVHTKAVGPYSGIGRDKWPKKTWRRQRGMANRVLC